MTNSHSKWLVGMLFVSILTNIIFAVRLYFPDILRQLQLAFIPAPELTAVDHVRGPDKAAIMVIVYTDYQCPYCLKLNEHLKALMPALDFRLAYRHFADPENRPLSFKAAMAAECAADQGQFWTYSDKLFEPEQPLNDERLRSIAQQLELDMAPLEQCMSTEKHKDKLIQEKRQAETMKITATPTFFINGKRHIGLKPYEQLKQLLSVETAKKDTRT